MTLVLDLIEAKGMLNAARDACRVSGHGTADQKLFAHIAKRLEAAVREAEQAWLEPPKVSVGPPQERSAP